MSEPKLYRVRTAARLLAATGGLLLCLCFGPGLGQDAAAAVDAHAAPSGGASSASFALPPQIFDTPKPGRWPGDTASPAPDGKPAAASPLSGGQGVASDKPPTQTPARPPARPQAQLPAAPAKPGGQPEAGPANQPGKAQGHAVPLQVIIPPAGNPVAGSADAPPRQDARPEGAPAAPAYPVTGKPPVSAVSPGEASVPPGTAPTANSPPPAAAVDAAPARLDGQPDPLGPSGPSGPSDLPGLPGPVNPAATPPSQPADAAGRLPQASNPPPAASPGDNGPADENAPLRLDALINTSPTLQPGPAAGDATAARPAPITSPSARPPAPGLNLTDMVVPGALPELEPFDENSPEARDFDPGRALGIRDDSATPLQRFGDVIPSFSSGGAASEPDGEQPPFTRSRGPAGQLAY